VSLERGYAFVEMPSQSEGKSAMVALNDKTLRRVTINVIEVLPLLAKKIMALILLRRCGWFNSRIR